MLKMVMLMGCLIGAGGGAARAAGADSSEGPAIEKAFSVDPRFVRPAARLPSHQIHLLERAEGALVASAGPTLLGVIALPRHQPDRHHESCRKGSQGSPLLLHPLSRFLVGLGQSVRVDLGSRMGGEDAPAAKAFGLLFELGAWL